MGVVVGEDIISNRRVLTALNNAFPYGSSVMTSEKKPATKFQVKHYLL